MVDATPAASSGASMDPSGKELFPQHDMESSLKRPRPEDVRKALENVFEDQSVIEQVSDEVKDWDENTCKRPKRWEKVVEKHVDDEDLAFEKAADLAKWFKQPQVLWNRRT
eukprot:566463-Amphidinium_carterae.1